MNKQELIDGLTLDEYFKAHPDEEQEFIDEMARLHDFSDEVLDYPDHEWLEYA
jgi:hypothetical protein